MELPTFRRTVALVHSLLSYHPPQRVDLVLEVQSVAPLIVRDTEGFSLAQLDETIESMIQDFSFLKVGEEVALHNCLLDLTYLEDGRVNTTVLSAREMRYGTDFERVSKDVFAQFDLSWVLRSELKAENTGFANLRRKRALVQMHEDDSEGLECDVTQFITGTDRLEFVRQRQAELLQKNSQQSIIETEEDSQREQQLTEQHVQILGRLRRVLHRQQMFNMLQACKVHSDPECSRIARRLVFPNALVQDGGIENSKTSENVQKPAEVTEDYKLQAATNYSECSEKLHPPRKKTFSRCVIQHLLGCYTAESTE